MSYLFKRISDKYLKDIAVLYKDCFGIVVTSEELKKKYNTLVFGESYTGYVAIDGKGEVGAYYGVFPLKINIDGVEYLVGQSGDTMTGTNHRKRGLFTSLAKETYQLCEELKMAFVFGFPNDNSLPGFERKLDWKFYGKMQMFSLDNVSKIPLCETSAKFSQLQNRYQSFVTRKIKKQLIDFKELSLNSENTVVKDHRFFQYKASQSTTIHAVQINSFKFVFKANPHLMIGDVEPFDEKNVEDFIKTIRQLAKKIKAKKVQLVFSKNHWLFPVLSKKIKPTESLPIGFYEINSEFDYSKLSFSMLDYDTF